MKQEHTHSSPAFKDAATSTDRNDSVNQNEHDLCIKIRNGQLDEAKEFLQSFLHQQRQNKKQEIAAGGAYHSSAAPRPSFFRTIEVMNAAVRSRDLKLVQLLVKAGGRDVLLLENYEVEQGKTGDGSPHGEALGFGPFHQACQLINQDLYATTYQDEGSSASMTTTSTIGSRQEAIFNVIQHIASLRLVQEKTKDTNQNALHLLCNYFSSKSSGNRLVQYQTSQSCSSVEDDQRKQLILSTVLKTIQLLIRYDEDLIFQADNTGWTPLHYLCASCDFFATRNTHDISTVLVDDPSTTTAEATYLSIVQTLLNTMQHDILHFNPLFVLLRSTSFHSRLTVQLIKTILNDVEERGIEQQLLQQSDPHYGGNVLHIAVQRLGPYAPDVIQELLNVGNAPEQLILQQDFTGSNVLSTVCESNASHEMVLTLTNALGRNTDKERLITQKNKDGSNVLHKVCCCANVNVEVVDTLLTLAGPSSYKLCFEKDMVGCTPLHYLARSYYFANAPAVMKNLFDFVNNEELEKSQLILQRNNNGDLPIHWFVQSFIYSEPYNPTYSSLDVFEILITEGIKSGAFEEHEIGGLFTRSTNPGTRPKCVLDTILSKLDTTWDEVLPAMQNVLSGLTHDVPLIHGAIMCDRCSIDTMKKLVHYFPDSILTKDSDRKLPIQVAIDHELDWNNGMKEIVECFARLNPDETSMIHILASFGLSWDCGLKQIVESDPMCLEEIDKSTGLYPFMQAAAGPGNNLDSIYRLMKCRFDIVYESIMKATY